MELWFSEQVVTVLAHPVQLGEYRLVVHALALDVEERAFAERVIDARQHGRRRTAAGHPVVAARMVVQVMCGRNRDHGYGHYGQQRGHQYQCGFEAHSAVFRHLQSKTNKKWTTLVHKLYYIVYSEVTSITTRGKPVLRVQPIVGGQTYCRDQ